LKLFLHDKFSAFREGFDFAESGKGKDGWSVEVREGYSANGFFGGGISLSCGVLVLIYIVFMES
jgi:hypothetical protein